MQLTILRTCVYIRYLCNTEALFDVATRLGRESKICRILRRQRLLAGKLWIIRLILFNVELSRTRSSVLKR